VRAQLAVVAGKGLRDRLRLKNRNARKSPATPSLVAEIRDAHTIWHSCMTTVMNHERLQREELLDAGGIKICPTELLKQAPALSTRMCRSEAEVLNGLTSKRSADGHEAAARKDRRNGRRAVIGQGRQWERRRGRLSMAPIGPASGDRCENKKRKHPRNGCAVLRLSLYALLSSVRSLLGKPPTIAKATFQKPSKKALPIGKMCRVPLDHFTPAHRAPRPAASTNVPQTWHAPCRRTRRPLAVHKHRPQPRFCSSQIASVYLR